jgi:ATP-dependent DNA helicase RecG
MNPITLESKTEELPGIGAGYSLKLAEIGIKTAEDLLRYFPYRHEDFSDLKKTNQVKVGEKTCLMGEIKQINNIFTYRRKLIITEAILQDEAGSLKVVWFNQPYLANQINDQSVILAGKVAEKKGEIYLASPTVEKLKDSPVHAARIVPVYSETKGITSRWLRYVIKPLLDEITEAKDPLPDEIKEKYHLIDLWPAFQKIHFPNSLADIAEAEKRFAFEELFYIHLRTLRVKNETKKHPAIKVPLNLPAIKKLVESLPFQLTPGQKSISWRILQEIEKPVPMSRLLEGDVGSGKTAVMMLPALNTALSGNQVAFMAPTAVLAKQHHDTLTTLLKDFPVKIGLLTSETSYVGHRKNSAERVISYLKQGKIDILIGTHSLIQERVKFNKLALVVIDEQHRFGVRQRARLMEADQKEKPHLLSMTATPIPRTLALTVYGDLDLSLLKDKPFKQAEVVTQIVKPTQRRTAYHLIRKEIEKQRQAFVVCPRIQSDSEEEHAKTVTEEYKKLSEKIFPDFKVARLHGKLKADEKEKILKDFRNNKINILVTTSVIEVGVDIPNATAMIIEGAERFGLAQLHQMRGRIGRSNHKSYCLLFVGTPEIATTRRLSALVKCHDGFKLAEKDLAIRGPGSLTGQNQWGIPDLVMANLKDLALVEKTRQAAKDLLEADPELTNHQAIKEKVVDLETVVHLE